MRFLVSSILFLATVVSCTFESLTPAQESALGAIESIENKIDALLTASGYSAYETGANKVISEYLATQTAIPSGSSPAEDSIEYAQYEIGRIEAGADFAVTQTFITGAARETLVDAYKEYASIMRKAAGITGNTGTTAATESGAASAPGEPSVAGVNSAGGMLLGLVSVFVAVIALL